MDKLIKSNFLQVIKANGQAVVYHSLFGHPLILNDDALELLNCFRKKTSVESVMAKKIFAHAKKFIALFKDCFFLISPNFDERDHLRQVINDRYLTSLKKGAAIEYLSLIVSEKCNFACTYCIANSMIEVSERRNDETKIMNLVTAKSAIDSFFSILRNNNRRKAYVNFGGGEPLLNFRVIEWALRYIQNKYTSDFEINYTINTNASLITLAVAKTFKHYGVKIALSLDGLEMANNAVRKTRSGRGTFYLINRAIRILNKIDYNPGGFATTLAEKNFDMINIEKLIEFSKANGFAEFRLDLDVIHSLKIPLEKASSKLLAFKHRAKEAGLAVTGFWERPAENLNESILDKLVSFCGGVAGKSMCVSPTGDIFICGYSAKKISDVKSIDEFAISPAYFQVVAERSIGKISRCRGCPIEGLCGGGCYVTEEFETLNSKGALEYNCRLFRKLTKELLKDSLQEAIAS